MAFYAISFVLLLVTLLVYKTVNLFRYVSQAKATGLPYVITPVLETEVVGLLATPLLRWIYHDHLDKGQGWPKWCRFIIKDWQWEDKRLVHEEFGDTFLCVSPEGIICYTADAAVSWDVMNRRYDFTKPRDKYKLLEPYGPNVATAEGSTYRFHVRITAPPFGDLSGANDLVWRETLQQTRLLTKAWSTEVSRELQMDVNSLTLAVIALAGFGKRVDWTSKSDGDRDVPPGYKMSFLKAINDTTAYMVAILLFPGWFLNLTPLKKAHVAHQQLDKYLRSMIRTEREQIERNADYQNTTARGNLLTAVLKASANEATQSAEKGAPGGRKQGFTEEEVMGNLFIYLLAGYETTANAIAYGLVTLALRPDIQDQVFAEIESVYAAAAAEGRTELTYADDFEKLSYTYGFMYETFRLYPGVTLITKVCLQPQPIPTPNGTTVLPANTRVYLSAPGTHYNPRFWPEPEKLDPHRWTSTVWTPSSSPPVSSADASDMAAAAAAAEAKVGGKEDVGGKRVVAADKARQMRGTLLTFSDGSRVCLGRKFAQAEYMAFLVAVLRDYRVVVAQGSDPRALERDVNLKSAGKVTLAMVDGVKLGLERRR